MKKGSDFNRSTEHEGLTQSGNILGELEAVSELQVRGGVGSMSPRKEGRRGGEEGSRWPHEQRSRGEQRAG